MTEFEIAYLQRLNNIATALDGIAASLLERIADKSLVDKSTETLERR